MIYFDNNKQAYAFEIENYVATVNDTTWQQYAGTDKWDIVDGVFTDITDTEEYIIRENKRQKEQKISELQQELEELDKKRIRAICEPSMKTETQSWLEFYNEQIRELREVMASFN